MSVALWTSRFPLITRAPWLSWLLGRLSLVHRRSSLFDLQKQWVSAGTPLHEYQIDLHPHAADPDDLPHHIDLREPIEEDPSILLKCQSIFSEEVVNEISLLLIVDCHPDRWLLGDSGSP